MTKRVLLLGDAADYHSIAVKWGLEQLSTDVHFWERQKHPVSELISIDFPPPKTEEHTSLKFLRSNASYSAIWNRRGGAAKVSPTLAASDHKVASAESQRLLDGIVFCLERSNPNAIIINRTVSRRPADHKLFQLHTANECGFTTPRTLISNSPDDVRNFVTQLGGKAIAKYNFPFVWRTKDGRSLWLCTTLVDLSMLNNDASISSCPIIFQEFLSIDFEVRLIIFGKNHFSLERRRTHQPLTPGEFADGRLDEKNGRKCEMSASVLAQCQRYMDELGLNYCAFDFAITANGSVVFLEANESGQFLYLEHDDPEIPILDAFVRFLASGDPDYKYIEQSNRLRLSDFDTSATGESFMETANNSSMEGNLSPFELVD